MPTTDASGNRTKRKIAGSEKPAKFRDVTKSVKEADHQELDRKGLASRSTLPSTPETAPRRRGRPPDDPGMGAASMAKRAARHRGRLHKEMEALVVSLRSAMHGLVDAGDHHRVGWMFWAWAPALDAIRRYNPRFAKELEELEARSKAYVLEMQAHRAAPRPPRGPKQGSILLEGSVFSTDAQGNVLRDSKKTDFRVKPQIAKWTLVEERPNKARRVQDGTLHDAEDALFTAATILIERDKGGAMETICPPVGTWQPYGQQFPMPAVTDPPSEVRRVLDTDGASSPDPISPAKTIRRKASETPSIVMSSDSARTAGTTERAARPKRKAERQQT
jgi:hypothetical protein